MEYKPKHKFKLDLSEAEELSEEKFIHVNCPSCNTRIESDGLELTSKIAKCNSCHAVFPFNNELSKLKSQIDKATVFQQPKEIEKFYFGEELDLSFQQNPSWYEVLGVMIAPIFGLITMMGYYKGKVPIYIPLILLFVGAAVIVSLMNLKKHKTHLRIESEFLTVEHRPKKGKKDAIYKSKEIDQLYVTKYTDSWSGAQVYGVQMVLNESNGQKHVRLAGGLKTIREAKFIEQEIESHLNIKNEAMIEEVNNA